MRERSIGAGLVKGAIAGAVATWAMGQVTTFLYEQEPEEAREREERARGGKTAYVRAAERAADAAGRELTREQRQRAGSAVHWALGIGAGAAYGALREAFPQARLGGGTVFGTGFWLVMDEIAVPALGLTPGPEAFPWETHARGLAGHVVFGAVADGVIDVLDRVV